MSEKILEAVVAAITKQKRIDPAIVHSDSTLEQLGISSLDAITIVYDIEERFDVEVPNEQLENLKSVADIVRGIASLMDAPG